MSRKVLQIVVPQEQRDLIDLVLRISGEKVSSLVRRLLLEWAASKVRTPGVMRGGVCGIEGCRNVPADHFQTAHRLFICSLCAERLKKAGGTNVVVVASDVLQPAINLDKMRAAIEEELRRQNESGGSLSAKSSAELLRTARDAIAELMVRGEGASGEHSFDNIVERFS